MRSRYPGIGYAGDRSRVAGVPRMLLALSLLACATTTGSTTGASTDPTAGGLPRGSAGVLTSRVTEDGLTQEEVDLDGDGKAEIVNYYRASGEGRLLLKKDLDLNRDGRMDVRSTFDEGGLRILEEMDGDFDGRADVVDHYISGKRSMTEKDTDFDGTFDLFSYHEGGKVRRKERDSDRDGKVDFWEYLDDSGAVMKTGRDSDGDGVMDERSQ
jgi:hypothetical protein